MNKLISWYLFERLDYPWCLQGSTSNQFIYQVLFLRPVLKLVALSGRFDLQTIDGAVNLSSRVTAKFSFLIGWEDLTIVDGAVNGLANVFKRWGAWFRQLQTGRVQHYLYSVVLGIFCLCVFMFLF